MKHFLPVTIFVVFVKFTCTLSQQDFEGTYQCYDPTVNKKGSGDEYIFLVIPNTHSYTDTNGQQVTLTFVKLFIDGYGLTPGCYQETVDNNQLSLKVPVQPFGGNVPNPDCGITAGSDKKVYNVRFIASQNAASVQSTDYAFTIDTCTFQSTTAANRTGTVQAIIQSLGVGNAVETNPENVALLIVSGGIAGNGDHVYGDTSIDTCELNSSIQLRLQLGQTAIVKGIRGLECSAAPNEAIYTAGNDTRILKLIENTCAANVTGYNTGLESGTGFGYGPARATNAIFTSNTRNFGCFRFMGDVKTLYIRCTYDFCPRETDNECAQNNCQNSSRRRRALTTSNVEDFVDATITVQPPGYFSSQGINNLDSSTTTDNGCYGMECNMFIFIVVVTVLALLLLVSCFLTIYVFNRLKRKNKSYKEEKVLYTVYNPESECCKEIEKEAAFQNPTYSTYRFYEVSNIYESS